MPDSIQFFQVLSIDSKGSLKRQYLGDPTQTSDAKFSVLLGANSWHAAKVLSMQEIIVFSILPMSGENPFPWMTKSPPLGHFIVHFSYPTLLFQAVYWIGHVRIRLSWKAFIPNYPKWYRITHNEYHNFLLAGALFMKSSPIGLQRSALHKFLPCHYPLLWHLNVHLLSFHAFISRWNCSNILELPAFDGGKGQGVGWEDSSS